MSISSSIDQNNPNADYKGKFYPDLIPWEHPDAQQNLGEVLATGNSALNPTTGIPQSATDFDNLGCVSIETGKVYQGNNLALQIGEAGDTLQIKGATAKGSLLVGNGVNTEELVVLPAGNNGQVLIIDDTQPLGVRWGGEAGDINSITAGNNINITGPTANPIVELQSPLTSNLNMGGISLVDSVASVGTAGQVLSAGAGGLTLWTTIATPATEDLATTLLAGNSAGATDIDLNDNTLLRCAEITSTGDLMLNPVGSIDANGKTLNMTNGEIHNCPLIHSQNNNDIDVEAKGTGNVVLKTANTDRLTINDTGEWEISGGVGTAGEVLLSNGVGSSPSWGSVPVPANVFNNIVYFGNATATTPLKLYYLDSVGDWVLADNTNSQGKLLAFAVGTDSSVAGMWIASNTGNIPIVVADGDIGGAVFVSSVAGEITGIQPAGQDLSLVRQVGYKISATEIKFFLYPIYITPIGMNGYGIATQIGGTSSTITDTNQYTLLAWTALSGTRTFTISVAGLFDILMVGGGGGGGSGAGYGGEGGGGGGAGQVLINTLYLPVGTYDINVGAGGAEGVAGGIVFGGSSGFNLQPVGSAGTLKYEALGGVCGGSSWSGGKQGYNAGGASYRGGYGGNPAIQSFGIYGSAGGSSNGSGNNGGGGGAGGAGSQRTITNPPTATAGGGGVGITTTFTGVSTSFGVGGCAGGNSGSVPSAPSANTGSGGAGAIGAGSAQAGASGYMAVRFRI